MAGLSDPNVSTSLALAKYQLGQQGITNATPEQLKTALNGGTITIDGKPLEYQGVPANARRQQHRFCSLVAALREPGV